MTTQELRDIETRLSIWRADRHIDTKNQKEGLIANLLEELTEYARAASDDERIDSIMDQVVFLLNAEGTITTYIKQDVLEGCDKPSSIINLAREIISNMDTKWKLNILFSQCRKLGYDPYKCMRETIKEISSRKQDPSQKEQWDKGIFLDTDKWKKWKEQPIDTLYKADYSKCKI